MSDVGLVSDVGLARAVRHVDGTEPQAPLAFDSYLDEEPGR